MTDDTTNWEQWAGRVIRRNGAWLVFVTDPEGEATPDAECDAASSLVVAKRLAVEMARGWGFSGRHWWNDDMTLWFTRYNAGDR